MDAGRSWCGKGDTEQPGWVRMTRLGAGWIGISQDRYGNSSISYAASLKSQGLKIRYGNKLITIDLTNSRVPVIISPEWLSLS